MGKYEEIKEVYNRLFQLDPRLWADLRKASPRDIVRRTEVRFNEAEGIYEVPFLNRRYTVDAVREAMRIHDHAMGPEIDFQVQLVLMTYLSRAGEVVPLGRMVTEKELRGGITFFQGPHKLNTAPLLRRFGKNPRSFIDAGRRLEGAVQEYGDASFVLPALPKLPVGFILYCGDDEFPPEMVVTFDASIEAHFQLDVVWALVNVTVEALLAASQHANDQDSGE
ncbi:MAG: DUF3786 domain-containing protein [Deltaproteobacteria bacterium]|nr:DUF3786 domain-containing protein [Deltaproteobacteria bacterium]